MDTEYMDRMENFILAHQFFCKWLKGEWSYKIARRQCEEEGIKLTRFHYLMNMLYCAYVYWKLRPAIKYLGQDGQLTDDPF